PASLRPLRRLPARGRRRPAALGDGTARPFPLPVLFRSLRVGDPRKPGGPNRVVRPSRPRLVPDLLVAAPPDQAAPQPGAAPRAPKNAGRLTAGVRLVSHRPLPLIQDSSIA